MKTSVTLLSLCCALPLGAAAFAATRADVKDPLASTQPSAVQSEGFATSAVPRTVSAMLSSAAAD